MTDNNKVNESQANFYQTIPGSHSWDNFEVLLNWARYKKSVNEPISHDYLIRGLENSYNRQPEIELEKKLKEKDKEIYYLQLQVKDLQEQINKR